jgi:hypothetical protein
MSTLQFEILNLVELRKQFIDYFRREKNDGIKKAWYYWHHDTKQPMAADTRDMFDKIIMLYASQGILHSKSISKDGILGVKKATMHVFRNIDETKKYSYDQLSLAFGYMPADNEMVVVEVCHNLPAVQVKKKKRK